MTRTVHCVKLEREAEGLKMPPYPGQLGQRIFENVSRDAWQEWLRHQTMLINEYRLTPIEPKDRAFLEQEMEKYFFGDGSAPPQEFVDPDA
ncbi:MAG: oxidative damage protection protein [Gammaproteobacteria bacterium]|nr:oxidative damage protection protein [Gammaproteobacteria bacterium]MCP5199663.1 oxidative damage protection protein [Gammaproteobacteria bacterium]